MKKDKNTKRNKDNKNKNNKNNNGFKDWLSKNFKYVLMGILAGLIVANVINYFYQENNKPEEVNYNEFQKILEKGEVEEVYIDFYKSTFNYKLKDDEQIYQTDNPRKEGFKESLLIAETKVLESDSNSSKNNFMLIFQIVLWSVIIFIFIKMSNIGGISLKNKKEDDIKIKFTDIAGNKEAVEEMKIVVQFIQNKDKYDNIGAKIPKGVMFYGPPGTGKTLLAKAVAGETERAFFAINASELVEKYVGVGASRVRKIFKTAKKQPSIIFIDEIDAIGGHRGKDGNSEREQTLNQILSEMDGFDYDSNVFVIAATNRIDTLDAALIRPGRFDKLIAINNPTKEERLEILSLYAGKIKLADDVDLNNLAKITINMSGASLEALVNEAAIIAVNKQSDVVTKAHLEESYLKLVLRGNIREDQQLHRLEEEIKLVAWHEAGHAVMSLKNGMNVPLTTILSSTTGAGGVTFSTPKKEGLFSKKEMEDYVKMLYAGRVCEYLLYDKDETKVTTGASSDIKQASKFIHDYIAIYGLGDKFGMFSPTALDDKGLNPMVVEESIQLSKKLYDETVAYLELHEELIKRVADALIEYNSIDEKQLADIVKLYEEETNMKFL